MNASVQKPHERIAQIKRKADAGPAILQYCFRPFFLGASLWAALSVPIWLFRYFGLLTNENSTSALIWHQHEMLFGFASAAIAGFILTAIPNWTARLPVSGWRLAALFALWCSGRLAMLDNNFIGPIFTSLLDLSFLTTLSFVILREILFGKNWRNLPIFLMLSLFAIGNVLVHAEILNFADTADLGFRLATFILALLVAVIGGRIIPSFTRNWLVRQGSHIRPETNGYLDKIALLALIIFVLANVIFPQHPATSYLALLTAFLHAGRFLRWKGWAVLQEPFMWAQHLGYFWLVVALAFIGISGLHGAIPASAATHALTTGAFATMILAVMTRASYTFTGRALKATPAISAIFVCVTLAATTRIAATFYPDNPINLLWISAFFWSGAFGLFLFLFSPILTRPGIKKRANQ